MGTLTIDGGEIFDRSGLRANSGISLDRPTSPDLAVTLAEGDLVTPGLVDLHCHLGAGTLLGGPKSWSGRYPYGVSQSECLMSGVVTAADAGTFGPDNIADAVREWAKDPVVQVRSWVFLFGEGLHDTRPIPSLEEICAELEAAVGAAPESIIGIKIRLGRGEASDDAVLLERARAAGERLQLPLMVHLTGSRLDAAAVFDMLRGGDVVTHAFHGREGGILDSAGKVLGQVLEAQRRGVRLDVGPGAHHFSWDVLEAALEMGAAPDTISSDLTYLTWSTQPICRLPSVVAQLAAGGIAFEQALYRATYAPAEILGVEISISNCAVVFRRSSEDRSFLDSNGVVRNGPGLDPVGIFSSHGIGAYSSS